MKHYSVKQLSELAGVSVRTLHLYDEIGLLSPALRTESGYRKYGETELLRLQQILFYRELGLPLQEIRSVLDDPGFDLVAALSGHRKALTEKKERLTVMLTTIDKTIKNLKSKNIMLRPEDLYEGLPKETVENYRKEAEARYGKENVARSEEHLRKLTKEEIQKLKAEQQEITNSLAALIDTPPGEKEVQATVERHYRITRKFWGTEHLKDKQYEAYSGLADLFEHDERFTMRDGKARPEFALFLNKAMKIFAENKLK